MTEERQQMDPSTREGGLGVFERYLTLWVVLCIVAGVASSGRGYRKH